ncbi:hypothetical protein [Nosocomiicoccus ampullae]|nr:hypothetical protein [Nosocomiicoccus ampullae]MDK6864051.1 hypothetical protein [Nosocomiicoccus ampullae]
MQKLLALGLFVAVRFIDKQLSRVQKHVQHVLEVVLSFIDKQLSRVQKQ